MSSRAWAPGGSTLLSMPDAFIVDAVRSPIGRRNGALSSSRGDELAAQVRDVLDRGEPLEPGPGLGGRPQPSRPLGEHRAERRMFRAEHGDRHATPYYVPLKSTSALITLIS